MAESVLPGTPWVIVCVFDCVLCVRRLLSVVKVGCEEIGGGGGEVELVSKFMEEFVV